MTRADILIAQNAQGQFFISGTVNPVIQTVGGVRYQIYIDRNFDVVFVKSIDADYTTWTVPTVIYAGTAQGVTVWYDRYSGIAAGLIHCAYVDDVVDDILYRTIDTESSDALGTETTVFAGVSQASGCSFTIWRERNGDLRVAGSIDAGAEDGAWSSTDDGATWGDTIADPSEGATQDQYFGLPGWNADTADGMIIFVDASANGLSVKRYDDSGDTWGETAIIADGSLTDVVATATFPHVAVCVDIANSRNIVVAWTAVDAANADLRLFFVDDTTVTESAANVVLNSTDDQGLCAVGIDTDTGHIYVFYGGKSDGSETFATAINTYYKVSTDDGATWGAETLLSTAAHTMPSMYCTPRFATNFGVLQYDSTGDDRMLVSTLLPSGGGTTNIVNSWFI